eukprot:m.80327 g.80327  ORF g.80327 m.80327 type:complete len:318 (+) comp14842_c0_seq1:133-1086(+)
MASHAQLPVPQSPEGVEVTYHATHRLDLHRPTLQEVVGALTNGLSGKFAEFSVAVVDCPDLSEKPFGLAAPGLNGSPILCDIGGVPYLTPSPTMNRIYDLRHVMQAAGMPDAFVLGAGAASFRKTGLNAELMPNVHLGEDRNKTTFAKVQPDGSGFLGPYSSSEFALLLNVFASKGEAGPVIKVTARKRTAEGNFVTFMREGLRAQFGDKPVGLGGAFLLAKGKANLHIMPDFSPTPLCCEEDTHNWLRFYEYSAPLTCLSVFVSHDPGLKLRTEHTHCFSEHGEGGHYHHDVTPEEVEYVGYFNVADHLYRVDMPA